MSPISTTFSRVCGPLHTLLLFPPSAFRRELTSLPLLLSPLVRGRFAPLPSRVLCAPHAGVTEDDNLPSNLKRNLTSLRELDQQSQELFERMQKLSKAHIARAKRSVQEGRDPEDDLLVKARKAYKDLMELDEEKVGLADRMSAEINKHYDHCASEMRKFEEELKEKGQLKTPQM